jgi:hypothetical protein
MALQADSAGFLIGGQPINPTRPELAILQRVRDDVRAIRKLLESKKERVSAGKQAANDPAPPEREGGTRTATPATPRVKTSSTLVKSQAPADVRLSEATRTARPALVNAVQPVATPKRITPERTVVDRAMPTRDASGRFVAQPKPAKPVLTKPVVVKVDQVAGGPEGRDGRGRFTGGSGEADKDGEGSKIGKLLGDIRDKIGGGVDLSGGEEVDPNIKAAQEIAGVAGSAFNGVKAVGGALGTIATPMLSGAKGLFRPKPNDAPTPWFKRFFNELRGLRREESVFNRAQLRTLKEIEAKPGEGKGGGFMGMLMMLIGPLIAAIGAAITAGFGLLMKLPGMGLLAKLATGLMPAALMAKRPITQPTTAPGAPAKNTTKTPIDPKTGLPMPDAAGKPGEPPAKKPGALARAGKGAMGVLKRVPLMGALLAAVGTGASVYESETSEASRAEKDKTTGKAIGGGGGAIAGMMSGGAAGAALGLLAGPIGAAIGGLVGAVAGGFFGEKAGAIVGETMGGWVTDLRNADIPGMIGRAWERTTNTMSTAWTDTTKWFEKKWDAALSLFGGIWDKAKGVFDDLSLGVTNLLGKFGIDLPDIKKKAAEALEAGKQKAKDAAAAVGGAVGAVKDKVVQGATAAVDYGKEKAGQAGEALKNSAMGKGASWVLGQTSKLFESGKGGAATVSTGAGDKGGASYGTYQLASKTGTLQKFLDTSGYGKQFEGLKAGTKEFDAKWKEVAAKDAGFGGAQHDFIKKTHYDPAMANLKKDGIDLSKHGAAVQDAVWSTSTQFGAGSKLINKALAGRDSSKMSDAEVVTAIQDYKIANNSKLFGGSSQAVQAGTAKRAEAEKQRLLALTSTPTPKETATNAAPAIPAAPSTNAVVTAGARAIPQMPSLSVEPPKVPDIQPVTAGLASTMAGGKEQRPSVIVVGNKTPVGRDLSNRPLAHIVTGGLSGS